MRSGNPVLKSSTFEIPVEHDAERMTLNGTVNKTAILLGLTLLTASYSWGLFMDTRDASAVQRLMLLGFGAGFVVALITIFKKTAAPYLAPIYALLQGLGIGGLSAVLELQFPGIVIQAVGLTFGTLFCLLAAYRSGLIKPTENFKLGVVAATGAIALLYLVSFVMSFFGNSIGFIHDSGPLGIAFSAFVVVIAAFNLVLDFDFIESGVEQGAPKYMEWYASFGLLVTLIWLYLEMLRLLAKLRR
jgi:uncharacterized YccA/Bax inhibitor family protein